MGLPCVPAAGPDGPPQCTEAPTGCRAPPNSTPAASHTLWFTGGQVLGFHRLGRPLPTERARCEPQGWAPAQSLRPGGRGLMAESRTEEEGWSRGKGRRTWPFLEDVTWAAHMPESPPHPPKQGPQWCLCRWPSSHSLAPASPQGQLALRPAWPRQAASDKGYPRSSGHVPPMAVGTDQKRHGWTGASILPGPSLCGGTGGPRRRLG